MKNRAFSYLKHLILLVAISLYLGSCAQLPEFAQPHISSQPFDPSIEYVSYRLLTVDDFKAVTPSDTIKDHQHMINAHTSVSLRPVTDIQYIISSSHNNFGLYKAYLQEVAFKAVMVPTRSWWNPQLAPEKTKYVLQHEQIHFALMEIAAQKEILKEHTAFDEDTSFYYDPGRQQQWYDTSLEKLENLSKWAR